MRLPTWFTIGSELGETAGFGIESLQQGEVWMSEGDFKPAPLISTLSSSLGSGKDLAVGVSIATDLSKEALEFIKQAVPTVGQFVGLTPPSGPNRAAIRGPVEARGYAVAIRDTVRKLATNHKADRIHLFLAIPSALALLLGHLWDRMPETQLYEDMGPGQGYSPSFLIPN
jgi:hypothetical protein